jgi:hypothetical protein
LSSSSRSPHTPPRPTVATAARRLGCSGPAKSARARRRGGYRARPPGFVGAEPRRRRGPEQSVVNAATSNHGETERSNRPGSPNGWRSRSTIVASVVGRYHSRRPARRCVGRRGRRPGAAVVRSRTAAAATSTA